VFSALSLSADGAVSADAADKADETDNVDAADASRSSGGDCKGAVVAGLGSGFTSTFYARRQTQAMCHVMGVSIWRALRIT